MPSEEFLRHGFVIGLGPQEGVGHRTSCRIALRSTDKERQDAEPFDIQALATLPAGNYEVMFAGTGNRTQRYDARLQKDGRWQVGGRIEELHNTITPQKELQSARQDAPAKPAMTRDQGGAIFKAAIKKEKRMPTTKEVEAVADRIMLSGADARGVNMQSKRRL